LITDDQVAALVREAGMAAPVPRPVDLAEVERRSHRDRATARALGGLAAAAALVILALSWGSSALRPTAAATGPNARDDAERWMLTGLAVLALLLVAAGIAAVLVRGRPATSTARRTVAAAWGVLAALLMAPVLYLIGTFVENPSLLWEISSHTLQRFIPLGAGFVALVWLAQSLRRRMLGRRGGGTLAAVWLVATWLVAGAVIRMLADHLLVDRVTSTSVSSVVVPTVLLVVAVAAGVRLLRSEAHPRPLRATVGLTVSAIASFVAVDFVSLLVGVYGVTLSRLASPLLVSVLALGVALLGSRVAARGSGAEAWTTAALVVLTACLAWSAATHFSAMLQLGLSVRVPSEGASAGYARWAVAFSLAATVSLLVLDRRLAVGRSARSDHEEPLPSS
jgi:hypothetical protein